MKVTRQQGKSTLYVRLLMLTENQRDCCTSFWPLHCNVNPIYEFLFWELRSLSPKIYIHASVSDLYIPRIGPHIFLQQNRQTDPENIYISHSYMSVGNG